MSGLTRNLAEFVASLQFGKIPADGVATAKRGFIDCVGVMFAGREAPVVRVLRESFSFPAVGEAKILFDKGHTTSPEAALLNATAGHALDYDDVAIDGHPSGVFGAVGAAAAGARLAKLDAWRTAHAIAAASSTPSRPPAGCARTARSASGTS